MRRIVNASQRFVRRVVTEDEARAELADEPYKLELIGLKGGSDATAARRGANVEVGARRADHLRQRATPDGEIVWKDLCRGPHLPNTG